MSAPPPRALRVAVGLRWLSRLVLAAGLMVAGLTWGPGLLHPRAPSPALVTVTDPLRKQPVQIDWSREQFRQWSSPEDGVAVTYPARYDATRAFGRFTSRDLSGGITEQDVVAFRSGQPRSVIIVAAYKAPHPLTWAQWVALAKHEPAPTPPQQAAPTAFPYEFGGSQRVYAPARVSGRAALAVSGEGALKYPMRGNQQMELWRFESRFTAEGDTAVRITAGVHADQYAGAREGLEKTLDSFRWTPPSARQPPYPGR
jgi:hypothetical protein